MRIMFRYTCAGIRIMMMQIKKGDRHRSRVVRTSSERRDKDVY